MSGAKFPRMLVLSYACANTVGEIKMAESDGSRFSLETWLMVGLISSLLLSTVVIALVSSNKETVFSPYDNSPDYSDQQLTVMRSDLGDGGVGYNIANTMSTPMLVNDWKEPHRTLLVIAAPEKPFDSAEATALYDFVANKGGKVILAANSTNAQLVAEEFGVKYFDSPVVDPYQYYEVADEKGERVEPDQRRLWSVASIDRDVTEMGEESRIPCSQTMITNQQISNCRMPVLFHRPTAIQVLDEQADSGREISVLAHASTPAFIARQDMDVNNQNNPTLGEGKTGLIVRIDYPINSGNIIDKKPNSVVGNVSATGSIVFVSDHSVFANHLWDSDIAGETGKLQCESPLYIDNNHKCWSTASDGLSTSHGSTLWNGNSQYFTTLIFDMMEFDNDDMSTTITSHPDQFNLVFDESRHVSSALSMPFTEAMGAIVLLTSDVVLKWLIILNLFALLSIAIMVVPEKENWRHVFDLTRFRERPNKVDSSQYHTRTREALLSKVRQFNDLTRDEFALKSPAEIMQLVRDPRLVELISSNRAYSNEELREVIPQIRRWGK
ncbi:MAG: hypothetical protein HOE79_07365 [Euryarchaeota archaeon]|nr:hypothetical protein [Euryarchaeota archaeon]